eukprot:CAMPEP_0194070050 /NCGR_PEP_ID=MMETSP0009_2-20130614/87972_1 /TAXON_ID=210454 /ORGANISM="Grammatophora oceanica, Strain CCMP 410" /LENGTH=263 /DNA_ID=CAMNT_0038723289 /DNA_START=1 /DNA_END=792 /DNA_ORIENTATION=+
MDQQSQQQPSSATTEPLQHFEKMRAATTTMITTTATTTTTNGIHHHQHSSSPCGSSQQHHHHHHHCHLGGDDKYGKRRSQTIRSGLIMTVASFCVFLGIGLVVWYSTSGLLGDRHFGAKMDTDVRHFANIKHPIKNTNHMKKIVMRREESRLRGAASAAKKRREEQEESGARVGGMDKLGGGAGSDRESIHIHTRDRAHVAAAAPGGINNSDMKPLDLEAVHAARRGSDPLGARKGALDEQFKIQRDSVLARGQPLPSDGTMK